MQVTVERTQPCQAKVSFTVPAQELDREFQKALREAGRPENVRKTVAALGGDGMVVLRGVEDQKAFDKGLSNATTAKALMVLLEKIARGQAVSRAASRGMSDILRMQQFNDAIPAGLPAGIPVGHKTGSITRINHDAAIVYAEKPYVLVVLTRGIEDGKKSSALIASISRVIYSTRRD